ncbi:NAD(P)/FAD-dependent oxidoreductase [Clostridium sp. HBUAS56017]|uniref:NAD(P)/FAD-dependent oxidoreductase n=1 Tax=Clostridium sp. HBUAS56017 TaxID=2571128 RepID=UPI001177EC3D|nr:NAD(P)/FAD-dependent oxidoreductase [Clostridium sp. HBUAS56017]
MIYHDIIVVGGGASGIMAAIMAKDLGKNVAIVESTDRIGKKILTTGNGRCNISNANFSYKNYCSEDNDFFKYCIDNFSIEDTENFFLSLGLPLVRLENGKFYPQSLQASSVVDIFRLSLSEREIPLYINCKIKSIHKDKKFVLSTTNEDYPSLTCGKLILACGGKSAIKTGSDGSGYKLAKSLGHSIVEPLPGIVQLKLNYPYLKALSGIKINGKASLSVDDKILRDDIGEILFTDYGISGPPILQLSTEASKNLYKNKKVEIIVDMMPEKSFEDIDNFLQGHLAVFSHRSISNALIGVINKKLIPILLKDIGIKDIHIPCYELDWKYKSLLSKRLKEWTFTCTDTNGFTNAQVTVGGINTNEVNPTTLESTIVSNLYFCGEILDVTGDCGGFNLQWAWNSGFLVGNSI